MRKYASTTHYSYRHMPTTLLGNTQQRKHQLRRTQDDVSDRYAAPAHQVSTILVGTALLTLIWHMVGTRLRYPPWLLPGPLDVLVRFRQAWVDGTLLQHVPPTLIESLGGFAFALVAGTTVGYCVAHSPRLERSIAPFLAAVQAIPIVAVAPL